MSVINQQVYASPGVLFSSISGGGGGGGGSSQFSTIGVSTLVASTIVSGSLASAVNQSALFYTSSISGTLSTTGTSTLLFTAPGTGTYSIHLNTKTGAAQTATWDGIVSCGAYEISPGVTKPSIPIVVAQTGGGVYSIAPYGDQSTTVGDMWFTTTNPQAVPYTGSFTRLNF